MGLFSRLLNLHTLYPGVVPQEDFFTEVVAYLLNTSPEILYAWIETLGLLDTSRYTQARISTQVEFNPLEHHRIGSRPDILIELSDEDYRAWIIIESKISSIEGADQLKRYAEVLDARSDIQEKILLYVTQHDDPKDRNLILQDIPQTSVRFRQFRWYTFHHFLQQEQRKHQDHILISELIKFMEENGMAQSNQFTMADVLALSNLSKVVDLMDATMMGQVRSRFKNILGTGDSSAKSLWGWQLRQKHRYLIIAWLNDGLWCGLGYYGLQSTQDYPALGMNIEISPKSKSYQKVVAALKEIGVDYDGWHGYNLNSPQSWAGVICTRSLRSFLHEEDHVTAIEVYFLGLLENLAEIKDKHPHLPWKTTIQDDLQDETE